MTMRSWVPNLYVSLVIVFILFAFNDSRSLADPSPSVDETLPAPQWIGLYDLKGKVGLKWIHNPRFAAVRIYRRLKSPGEGFELVAETKDNSFVDAQVVSWENYVYHLVAVGAGGEEGPPSFERNITIVFADRKPVSPPAWEGYLFIEKGVGLKWSRRLDEEVIAYNVYRKTPQEAAFKLVGSVTETSYSDQDLEPGQVYVYVLTALDSSFKESPFSEELSLRYIPPEVPVEEGAEISWRSRRTRLIKILTEGDGDFFLPADVAVGPRSGNIFLADSGNNKVQVFERQGRFLHSVGGKEAAGLRFRKLLGVAVDGDENIYCVDAGKSTVVVMNSDGSVNRRIDLTKYFAHTKMGLIDSAVGPGGRVFVVDNFNNRVSILGKEGLVRTFGQAGYQGGEFSAPTFCAMDLSGFFYLSDALNGRVQIFDSKGDFVRAFGKYSQGLGGLGRPKGVAVNARGEIYVADSWQNVIQVFDSEGQFLAVLTDEKGRLLDLGSPNGIALDSDNRIYIAERLSNRLQIREILDAE